MKKIVFLLLVGLAFTCSTNDDDEFEDFGYDILPIKSIEFPEVLVSGQIYDITYTYEVPSTCHIFNDLYYTASDNERTVAVINIVLEDSDPSRCEELNDVIEERFFRFYVTQTTGFYIFKLWQGRDENGDDIYDEYEIPVE